MAKKTLFRARDHMKHSRTIQTFLYSKYFADGIRISVGMITPSVIFSYLGDLHIGVTISTGAMVMALSDTHGPISHRRNGMFVCAAVALMSAMLTNLVDHYPPLLGVTIVGLSFLFAMLAVFGDRAATIGAMGTLIMVLNIDDTVSGGLETLEYAGYLMLGCAWYMLLSLSVTQVRPYRLAQQELAESIQHIAEYIRIKASFYANDVDIEKNYLALIDQQILAHEHKELVREMLFRSKKSVKDTTQIGRLLLLVFTDMVDLFEQGMASHYDYESIRKKYEKTGVLRVFNLTIKRLANEVDNIGYHLNSNRKPKPLYQFQQDLERIRTVIEKIEQEGNLSTLPLKRIFVNIRGITKRIDNVYAYFNLATSDTPYLDASDYNRFVSKQDIDLKSFRNNLTFQSNTFSHSLRLAVVMGLGYLCSLYLTTGEHSYWILLTIMVILKPGYGMTKQRNFQRLAGTIIGGISGILILILVQHEIVLFVFLLLFMIATYSFIRINYIVAVMFMTPFVLILFSFMGVNTMMVAQERIVDTIIGSVLAFASSYVIFPTWESTQVHDNMRKLLIANYNYLGQALRVMAGESIPVLEYKLARKDVYVTSANMGASFQRMITEPKSKRRHASDINRFVVFNHILSSYSVALITAVADADPTSISEEHIRKTRNILYQLAQSVRTLPADGSEPPFIELSLRPNRDHSAETDTEDSAAVSDQLNFLVRIASDIHKVVQRMTDTSSSSMDNKATPT